MTSPISYSFEPNPLVTVFIVNPVFGIGMATIVQVIINQTTSTSIKYLVQYNNLSRGQAQVDASLIFSTFSAAATYYQANILS